MLPNLPLRLNIYLSQTLYQSKGKGCDEQVLASIAEMEAKRIVYVSCDVATQARDIERLKQYGYHAVTLQPVDMFPQTYAVECVCLLERSELNKQ